MNVQFKRVRPMRVGCVSVRSANPENEAIDTIKKWARAKSILNGYGLSGYDNCQPHPNHIHTTRLTVGADIEASNGIGIQDVPGGLNAVSPKTGAGKILPAWS